MNKLYNPVFKLIFFLGIFVYSYQSIAQVAVNDSLTLVSLYNSSGGPSWTNHTNWLTANVPGWYGVKVRNNRVVQINLPSNNLTGAVTDSLYRLDSLDKVDLRSNSLSYFPALTGLHLDSLSLQNNKLTFRDLVPNKSHVDSFYYAPQDSADVAIDTTVLEQSSVVLIASIDNNPLIGDNYQWYRDTTSIVSGASNAYSILCMSSSNVGVYYTKITNGQLPALTIYRRAISLHMKQLADPGPDFSVCSSSSTLQGALPAGGSVQWATVSGGGAVVSNTSAISAVSNLSVGANVFQYGVTANNISCPANTFSYARITVTRDTNPSPPYAGADQSLCGPQAILAGSTPSVGVGTWTVTRGTGVIAQPNSPSSAVNGLSSGQNILRWQITNGACTPSFFDEVIIFKDDTLTSANAGMDTSICPTSYILSGLIPANTQGSWSLAGGAGTVPATPSGQFLNDTTLYTEVTSMAEGVNTLRWTLVNTCNSVFADVHVTVYNFTIANAGPDKEVYYSPINPYILADSIAVGTGGNGQYTYVWSPATNLDSATAGHPRFLTPDSGSYTYTVTVTDGHGCTASDDVNYHVTKSAFLTVPTLFTPNDDGLNDELYIPGVESYPGNELTVVDRNDQVVYKQKGYKNDWKGINEEGFSKVGQKLPADTYFYTLKLQDGVALQKGYFLIKY